MGMKENDVPHKGKQSVWRFRGCGLCLNPVEYMCAQCNMELRDQGHERIVENGGEKVYQDKASIVGTNVPPDFIYV
jgi:uncharacterized protein with PIN domain